MLVILYRCVFLCCCRFSANKYLYIKCVHNSNSYTNSAVWSSFAECLYSFVCKMHVREYLHFFVFISLYSAVFKFVLATGVINKKTDHKPNLVQIRWKLLAVHIWYFVSTPVPSLNYCDGLDRCILYCILFVFMFALLCFCVATEFSVNKDLYKKTRKQTDSQTQRFPYKMSCLHNNTVVSVHPSVSILHVVNWPISFIFGRVWIMSQFAGDWKFESQGHGSQSKVCYTSI